MDRFISYYGFYHKWVVIGVLAAFHVEVLKGYGSIQPRKLGYCLYF